MTDFLWAAFELFITFFENLTVCHFICRFLKLDLKSRKGIILYLIGCVSFSVIVTVINNFTLYEGVYGLIYTVMFFAYSLFLPGSVIKKAFAAILANIVIVCTNALVTSTISAASGNAVAEILGTHTLERVIAVLSVQILLIYIFGIILKITADKDVALRSSEWLLILSVFVVSFVSITFIHMSQLYSDYNENQTRILLIAELGLDLRKMEVGVSKLQVYPQLLNDWVLEVSADFISEGEARNVHIRYQLDEQITVVSFDREKCEIILTNLLINALKHSPEGGEILIQTQLLPDEQSVRVSVADQGCGLKQVDIHKLFTRFYQGSGERNGTGIGLSYSKILAELHGGSIGAKDNDTAGATFFFELPLQVVSEEIICQPKAYLNELITDDNEEKNTETNTFQTKDYSLLVVDDNQDLIDFLKDTMKVHFKQVYTAADGVEALEIVRRYQPDIVVSDVMMPRMNGYELCKQIKENIDISHIPVILLTARDDEQSQLHGYKIGADGYLTKPFEEEMLLELIRSRLRNREQTKVRYLNAGLLPAPEESTFSQADETFLLKLNKIIVENLDSSVLDIAFLCKEMYMSRATLYNKLKALTDMGANDYINKFRLERAIQLITTTDLNFTEIAERTGFSTSRYFSTAFKQYTGETPTQYKESHKRTS
mgnify:CR=1 FL=1